MVSRHDSRLDLGLELGNAGPAICAWFRQGFDLKDLAWMANTKGSGDPACLGSLRAKYKHLDIYRDGWRSYSLMSRLKLILLSALSVLVVSAVASTTASATEPLHYYNSSGVKLTAAPLLIDATGPTQVLKGVAGGLNIEITCSALDSHGTIDNPTGGGAGLGLVGLLYLGCTVLPATLECKIPEKMISTSVNSLLIGTVAVPLALFTPDPAGASFVKIKFEGCKNAGLNTEFPVEGSALGKILNTTSQIKVEEVKGSASMLKFGGGEAGLTGTETVEMTGGGKIEVKE